MSDLHISAPPILNPLHTLGIGIGGPSLPSLNSAGITNDMVEAKLRYIDRHYSDHFLIVTGDITDNVLPEEYNEAARLLRRFRGRILVCPGNHDFGILGNLPTINQALMFDRFESSLMVDKTSSAGEFWGGSTFYANKLSAVASIRKTVFNRVISVIGIDSNRSAAQEFAARGRIGDQQLDDLKKLLSMVQGGRPGVVQIVCLHHHPVPLQHSNTEVALVLVDADKFRNVIRGKVDLVLFGHKHYQTKNWQDGYQWLSSGASPKERRAHEIVVGPHGITYGFVRII